MIQTTSLDLFAGIPIADIAAALPWYERLLGSPPGMCQDWAQAIVASGESGTLEYNRAN